MKVIVLDRDGVINQDRRDYVKTPAEWQPIPGSLEAMGRLTRAGYEIVVASNQSGIGRGICTRADVDAIHARLRREAGLHGARVLGFYVCPHAPLAGCACRKPAAGLLRRIAQDFNCKPQALTFIGDSWRDLAAARAAGLPAMLVRTGRGAATLARERARQRDPESCADLSAAVDRLIGNRPGGLRAALGSILYNVSYVAAISVYGLAASLCAATPGGRAGLEAVAHGYARAFYGLLKFFARLDYRIEGREHIPAGPFVFYWKHESTWETLAPLLFVHRPAYVLKRQLLWIPLVGWPLARLGAIGINRGARRRATQQILKQGKRLIARGHTVIIFPEGHRMPPGKSRRYGLSGALLARAAGLPIVPVAHNSGDFWPRRGFIKRPGTVTVRIGPPIATSGRSPEAINLAAKSWIEGEMCTISVGYLARGEGSRASPA